MYQAIDASFNTTLLLFYELASIGYVNKPSFNTTLVTVLFDRHFRIGNDIVKFQYNSCYCSIKYHSKGFDKATCVSIQLLLLFYMLDMDSGKWHLVRFNTTLVTVLSATNNMRYNARTLFQYNSCYCSINVELCSDQIEQRFNTTLVTVL